MKKLSNREMIMIITLLVSIVTYGFLNYIWDPLQASKEELIVERDKKEDELLRKNVSHLERQKKDLEMEKGKAQLKIEEIKQEKKFGIINYQELIEYLGKEADSLAVDVVQFKKNDARNSNSYWELPYELTIQGDYEGIIRFINSLYELDNYFFVTGMDLREVARIPMTDKVASGEPGLKEEIDFEWATEFIEKLDNSIPTEMKAEMEKEFMDDFAKEMEDYASEMKEELLEKTNSVQINEKLQLEFMFHFVSLEEPKN